MQIILTAVDDALASAWERHCGGLPGVRIHRGSILDVDCDAVVSPANSFGFMDGGIDSSYLKYFGSELQDRLQAAIASHHHGELLVGAAEIVETRNASIPFLIAAPTMRVPMVLGDSVAPYLAARAVFLLVKHGRFQNEPLSGKVNSIAFPGLGTGIGQVGPNTCANQMRAALEEVWLGANTYPRTWAEASERHQLLYTSRPARLQR